MKASAEFVKANPVPDEVKAKRDKVWAKQGKEVGSGESRVGS